MLIGDTGWNLINGNAASFFFFFNGRESAFFGASRMFALNEAVCMEALFAARDVCIRHRGDSTMNGDGFLYI